MKKILIIGAGFLQTYVIKKAKELGYYVLCVDGNPKAEGYQYAHEYEVINITDKEACLLYAKEKQIDGVITAATDYGVLTASYIAETLNLYGNSMKSAQLIKNKYQVRKRLFEAKADDTEQAYEISEFSQVEKIKEIIQYPVMVKPCDGSGSRGASKVECESQLCTAIQCAIEGSLTKKAVIEWLKKSDKRPITRNPYFFLFDFKEPQQQTLTFRQYYERYGTTLEQDGWRMTNPTGQQVIYIKN